MLVSVAFAHTHAGEGEPPHCRSSFTILRQLCNTCRERPQKKFPGFAPLILILVSITRYGSIFYTGCCVCTYRSRLATAKPNIASETLVPAVPLNCALTELPIYKLHIVHGARCRLSEWSLSAGSPPRVSPAQPFPTAGLGNGGVHHI